MTMTSYVDIAPFAAAASTGPLCLTQPLIQDLCVYRGDSGRIKVTVTAAGGAQVDVSTATWDADIRATADTAEVLATFLVTPVPSEPASVYLDLSAAESAKLNTDGVYDLQMTLAGLVQTILAGKVVVTKDVSRS